MTPDQKFLIEISVQVAVAVGTLILAAVAIWGEPIRAYLVGPRLTLRLLRPAGDSQQVASGGNARFYHLQITNARRFAPAHNVRVVLTGIAHEDANGVFQWHWLSGPVQFTWQHGHSVQQFITIGAPQNADLGRILEQGSFQLSLLFVPIGLKISLMRQERMIVEARAQSDETESLPLRVRIAWDGRWSADAAEMARHLVLQEEIVSEET